MEVKFSVEYHNLVMKDDIPKIPKSNRDAIRKAIESKLMTNPVLFGKPLRRSFKNYRSLRVGDYRVIFSLSGKKVKIWIIQHRSVVYENNRI